MENTSFAEGLGYWTGQDDISSGAFDLCPDAILVSDTRGLIVRTNPQARTLFFFEEAELLRRHIQSIIPRASSDCGPGNAGRPTNDYEHRSTFNQDLRGIRRDLSEFPLRMTSHCLEVVGNIFVLNFVRDISTERAALSILTQTQEDLRSMIAGASDYSILTRRGGSPFSAYEVERLRSIANQIAASIETAVAAQHNADLTEKLTYERKYFNEESSSEHRYEDIVGDSAALRRVLDDIETVAPTPATVLIQGETGTGKELFARTVHRLSPRSDKPFIRFNCAAIPAGLIESELFGHERGAFTGAIARKIGRLELANEGTLFLDEVGELPLDLQPKLLRALQEREIERLGGTRTISVDIRLIAATNRDLQRLVELKEFRSDLYYRLKVFPVYAPALRDRREDIPILVRHFVDKHSRRMGKTISSISNRSMEALVRWNWPGNIRELENFIERAVILTRGDTLHVQLAELEETELEQKPLDSPLATLRTAERDHILKILRETEGRISGEDGAAKKLGLKRTTLYSKLRKLGVERSDY